MPGEEQTAPSMMHAMLAGYFGGLVAFIAATFLTFAQFSGCKRGETSLPLDA